MAVKEKDETKEGERKRGRAKRRSGEGVKNIEEGKRTTFRSLLANQRLNRMFSV